jgi:proteasome assembly chaperone (PAC2) family protein
MKMQELEAILHAPRLQLLETAKDLGAARLITLGAFLADVAHTRRVPIVGSASDREEAARLQLSPSSYEGPTGIIGVTHDIANRAGLESVSFWAAVPHYIPVGENPKASLALIARLASYLEMEIDTERLERTASVWEASVTDQIRDNEALAHYLDRLEDSDDASDSDAVTLGGPSGDQIAEEIERFLQERRGGDE